MYLFSRTSLAALGKQGEAIPAAIAIADKVGSISGHEIKVMSAHFGAPLGTIMWTTTLESHAQRQEMLDALTADQSYLEAVAAMAPLFMTSAEDRISRFLSPPVEPTSKYYAATRAAMADGHFAEAVEFGLEISDYMTAQTGMPGAFLKPSFGGFGDVTWVRGFASMSDVDQFADWEMGDAGYQSRVKAAAGLFVPNSGTNSMIEQLN